MQDNAFLRQFTLTVFSKRLSDSLIFLNFDKSCRNKRKRIIVLSLKRLKCQKLLIQICWSKFFNYNRKVSFILFTNRTKLFHNKLRTRRCIQYNLHHHVMAKSAVLIPYLIIWLMSNKICYDSSAIKTRTN